jgi:hypothetical protein
MDADAALEVFDRPGSAAQGERMEGGNAGKGTWLAGTVTFGQLLVALSPFVVMYGTLVIQNETRLARIEERQNINTRTIAEERIVFSKEQVSNEQKFLELRKEILSRLDLIGADVVILRITLAKHDGAPGSKGK